MPTLNWIGKDAVETHHKHVPFRLLEPVDALSCGDKDSGNLIVQGDNLLALKALLPRFAGEVKCIYIDPPYNTGNEGWVYNDNVNSPEIRKWLGGKILRGHRATELVKTAGAVTGLAGLKACGCDAGHWFQIRLLTKAEILDEDQNVPHRSLVH